VPVSLELRHDLGTADAMTAWRARLVATPLWANRLAARVEAETTLRWPVWAQARALGRVPVGVSLTAGAGWLLADGDVAVAPAGGRAFVGVSFE
ncbi:MAG TPA: hypothetical protein VFH51_06615, partial [Myxococcota bacterium]|nr:hypothetical protein [Myxococcota bacterium]